jgi:hypothetical protein
MFEYKTKTIVLKREAIVGVLAQVIYLMIVFIDTDAHKRVDQEQKIPYFACPFLKGLSY